MRASLSRGPGAFSILTVFLAVSSIAVFGQTPTLTVSPSSLSFAEQLIGSTSAQKTITASNTGTVAVSIASIVLSRADFKLTNGCPIKPKTLAAGRRCTIKVAFAPTAIGKQTASVLITDNAAGSPQSVALKGVGTEVSLSPTSLSFGSQAVGTASLSQQVTVTNAGGSTLTISKIVVQGTDPSDFQEAPAPTCGSSLAAGASCAINITFVPIAGGSRTAVLAISDSGGGGSQTVSLTGQGLAPTVTLSTSSLQFGNESIGTTSSALPVTVTNTGSAGLFITGIAITGANPTAFSQSNNCPLSPGSLATGANCTINVTFAPSTTGALTAALLLSDYVQGSPQVVSLFGSGVDQIAVSVTPGSAVLQTGVAQQFTATVSNTTNTAVAWSVNNIPGGNPSVGTVDANGIYTAPAAVPAPTPTVTITATSQADSTKTASAYATIITRSLLVVHQFNQAPVNDNPTAVIQGRDGLLYGSTYQGGSDSGVLYNMTTAGQSFSVLYTLTALNSNGVSPLNLMQGVDGDLYGTTWSGGCGVPCADWGVLYDYNSASGLTVLHYFSEHFYNAQDGFPWGPALVQDTQGNLYGYGDGGIFQYGTQGGPSVFPLCTLGSSDGQTPSSLVLGLDGNLYGSTQDGGNGAGEVFKCTPQGQLTPVHVFSGSDGSSPVSLVQTSDSTLWGVTQSGTLFEIKSSDDFVNSNVFSVAYSIGGSPSALIVGNDGNLYGTTLTGGTLGAGTVFEYAPTGGLFAVLYNFSGAADGCCPFRLIQGQDGTFYGLAETTLTAWGEVFSFGVQAGGVTSPVLGLSNYSLVFGSQEVGSTSTPDTLTVESIGTANLNISSIAISGTEFVITGGSCNPSGQVLAPGAVCNMFITFTPSASGARSASLTIMDNAAGSPQTVVPLSGTGIGGGGGGGGTPVANVSPLSLNFGNQTVGNTSGALTSTLRNAGTADLSITSVSVTGPNASEFPQTSNCPLAPATLAINLSCTINVTFTPAAAGTRTASLAVTDNAGGSPQSVNLTGTGASGPGGPPPPPATLSVTSAAVSTLLGFSGSVTLAWATSATSGCGLTASPPTGGLPPPSNQPLSVPCSSSGYMVNIASAPSVQPYTITLTAPNYAPGSITVYALPSVTYGAGAAFGSLTNYAAIGTQSWVCELLLGCSAEYGTCDNTSCNNVPAPTQPLAEGLSLALTAGGGLLGATAGDADALTATYGPFNSIPLGYTQYLTVQPQTGLVTIQACTVVEGGAGSAYFYQANDSANNSFNWTSPASYCVGLLSGPLGNLLQQAWGLFQDTGQIYMDAQTLFQSSVQTVQGLVPVGSDLATILSDLGGVDGVSTCPPPVGCTAKVGTTTLLPCSVSSFPNCLPLWVVSQPAGSGYTYTAQIGGSTLSLFAAGAGQAVLGDTLLAISGIAAQVTGTSGPAAKVIAKTRR